MLFRSVHRVPGRGGDIVGEQAGHGGVLREGDRAVQGGAGDVVSGACRVLDGLEAGVFDGVGGGVSGEQAGGADVQGPAQARNLHAGE